MWPRHHGIPKNLCLVPSATLPNETSKYIRREPIFPISKNAAAIPIPNSKNNFHPQGGPAIRTHPAPGRGALVDWRDMDAFGAFNILRNELLAAAVSRPELLPVRILAGVALIAVIAAFVHVLRHLKEIERTIVEDDLVPEERGPRNNMVLIVCAIPIIVVALLLFLVMKA